MSPGAPGPALAHAVLHCNLNIVDLDRSLACYVPLAGDGARLIRSVSTDSDGTPMGLPTSTASETAFVYDQRGPRSAPALELVCWSRPATGKAGPVPPTTCGFHAIGFRVASVADRHGTFEMPRDLPSRTVWLRGAPRKALVVDDPDGVPLELVEVAPASTDPAAALFSHVRLSCRDLSASLTWYGAIGFTAVGSTGPASTPASTGRDRSGRRRASLVLPEDPTFSLELEEVPDGVPPVRKANDQGVHRIALATDDVVAAHAALARSWPTTPEPVFIPMPDMATGGFTVLFLTDPDGAVVELVDRPRASVRRPLEPR